METKYIEIEMVNCRDCGDSPKLEYTPQEVSSILCYHVECKCGKRTEQAFSKVFVQIIWNEANRKGDKNA